MNTSTNWLISRPPIAFANPSFHPIPLRPTSFCDVQSAANANSIHGLHIRFREEVLTHPFSYITEIATKDANQIYARVRTTVGGCYLYAVRNYFSWLCKKREASAVLKCLCGYQNCWRNCNFPTASGGFEQHCFISSQLQSHE